jgi:hypothetical protein
MLPAGGHVHSVHLEEQSILTAARKDALLIDCSTIDIDSARGGHVAALKAGFGGLNDNCYYRSGIVEIGTDAARLTSSRQTRRTP